METITAFTILFASVSAQLDLPAGLLASVCFVETRHDANAINRGDGGSDSYGICQIKHKTAKWMGFTGTEVELMDPRTNAYYAGKYLAYQISRQPTHEQAVIAYNQGHNRKRLTTTRYSAKVMSVWRDTTNERIASNR